jgi:dolichol kinase
MTRPPLQRTRYQSLTSRWSSALLGQLRHSWRAGSLALLSLLLGFFIGQNLTGLLMQKLPGGRPAAVLLLVLTIELVVRLRSRSLRDTAPLGWVLADNLRIGLVYAVVLEAFKLGT